MHCFNIEYTQPAGPAGPFHPGSKNFRQDADRAGSQSGSDDGAAYVHYADPQKHDLDLEENPNAGLTSQTLNADGTPKRPMNAFMIFARRRRPQVSAENQSMRTGEISKILSREWNAMDMAEKQFYLDQAKQLKESFNTKYPDYVYRRRPNNSRKRRKTEPPPLRALDHPLAADPAADFGEHSSIEGEELLEHADLYARHHPASAGPYPDAFACEPRPAAYPYTPEPAFRADAHDARLPYLHPPHERADGAPLDPPRAPDPPPPQQQPHHHPHYPFAAQPEPLFPADQGAHGGWEPARAAWPAEQHERPRSATPSRSQGFPSPAPAPLALAAGVLGDGFPFPTLGAPFFPASAPLHGSYAAARAGGGALFDPRSYARPASVGPQMGFAQEGHMYAAHHPRPLGLPRLPSIPAISTFAQAQAMHGPVFWAREKVEGQ